MCYTKIETILIGMCKLYWLVCAEYSQKSYNYILIQQSHYMLYYSSTYDQSYNFKVKQCFKLIINCHWCLSKNSLQLYSHLTINK